MCRQAAGLIARDDEKRLLLGTLSNIESPDAMELISPYLDDANCRQEAVLAAVTVAEKLLKAQDAASFAGRLVPSLEKAAQAAENDDLAKRAKAVLDQARSKVGSK